MQKSVLETPASPGNAPLRIFGFGSLVNPKTHPYRVIKPFVAQNQIREWVTTPAAPVAFLSMRACQGVNVAGLVMEVTPDFLPELDRREAEYTRHDLGADLVTYRATAPQIDPEKPILLSYLDCVMQGFLRELDQDAAEGFFGTTQNWERPILDDRNAPRYPRAQALSKAELSFVDAQIAAHDLQVIR